MTVDRRPKPEDDAGMDFRQHSYEFDTLPSERSDISPAARELARLAWEATSWASSIRAFEHRRNRERRNGRHLDSQCLPGHMISRQSEASREKLRALTSEDALVVGIPMWFLHEENWSYGEVTEPPTHTVIGSGSHVGRLSMSKKRG